MAGCAFIVHIERATPIFERTVVHHRAFFRCHQLAHAPGERRGALAIEIALQPVTDGLVQQYPGPTGSEHDFHAASGRRGGVQIDQGLAHRLARITLGHVTGKKIIVIETAATALAALFATPLVLYDDRDIEAHQGADIRRHESVAAHHQDDLLGAGKTRHYLLHPRVLAPRLGLHRFQEMHLGRILEARQGIHRRIQLAPRAGAQHHGHACDITATVTGDGTRRASRIQEGRKQDIVGIGETGFFAADGAYAHALFDIVTAGFYLAFFQCPGFMSAVLKIQIGVIHLIVEDAPHEALQFARTDASRRQQKIACLLYKVAHARSFRCWMLGKLLRIRCCRLRSQSAMT